LVVPTGSLEKTPLLLQDTLEHFFRFCWKRGIYLCLKGRSSGTGMILHSAVPGSC
ncbi:hypothetical protein NDU88_007033, partial [Pleurodeles waltl]